MNRRGFSLIELMMSVAVVSVSVLAVLSVSKNISDAGQSQTVTANADTLAALISQNLRFQATCAGTVANGAARITLNELQALNDNNPSPGFPIAVTLPGIRGGAAGNVDQLTGFDNSVNRGLAPTYPGATSDLPVMGLRIQRIAFQKLGQDSTGTKHFGYVYMIVQKDDTGGKLSLGGNAIARKNLGGVVLVTAGANQIVDCYGNSGTSDLSSLCTSMGCTYNGSTCDCPRGEFNCPPGAYLVNITNGIPLCKKLGTSSPCPAGQYLVGIGLDSIQCAPVPDEVVAPTCVGGATTTVSAVPASPQGCYCAAGQNWNTGTSMCEAPQGCSADGDVVGTEYGVCAGAQAVNPQSYYNSLCCSGRAAGTCDAQADRIFTCMAASPVCPAGTSTGGLGGAASPAGCNCNSVNQAWNGTSCENIACYMRDQGTVLVAGPPVQCDTVSRFYSSLSACQAAVYPVGPCSSFDWPANFCSTVLMSSPVAANCPAAPAPGTCTPSGPVVQLHDFDGLAPVEMNISCNELNYIGAPAGGTGMFTDHGNCGTGRAGGGTGRCVERVDFNNIPGNGNSTRCFIMGRDCL